MIIQLFQQTTDTWKTILQYTARKSSSEFSSARHTHEIMTYRTLKKPHSNVSIYKLIQQALCHSTDALQTCYKVSRETSNTEVLTRES